MSIALAILAALAGLFGLVMSSSVAAGPSIVGFAVVLALLARLAQSHDHHKARRASQAPPPTQPLM